MAGRDLQTTIGVAVFLALVLTLLVLSSLPKSLSDEEVLKEFARELSLKIAGSEEIVMAEDGELKIPSVAVVNMCYSIEQLLGHSNRVISISVNQSSLDGSQIDIGKPRFLRLTGRCETAILLQYKSEAGSEGSGCIVEEPSGRRDNEHWVIIWSSSKAGVDVAP